MPNFLFSFSVQAPRDENALGSAGHGSPGADLVVAALELLDRAADKVLDVAAADDDGALIELTPLDTEGAVRSGDGLAKRKICLIHPPKKR